MAVTHQPDLAGHYECNVHSSSNSMIDLMRFEVGRNKMVGVPSLATVRAKLKVRQTPLGTELVQNQDVGVHVVHPIPM